MRRIRPEQIRELVIVLLIIAVLAFFSTQIDNYLNARFFNHVSTSVSNYRCFGRWADTGRPDARISTCPLVQ